MIPARSVRIAGAWSGAAADHVVLAYHDRHRRRIAMSGEGGLAFLLDLAESTVLRHGDGLVLDDGRIVEVRARPEPLLEVRGQDGRHLARLAWHLGNRHLPAAIEASRILIRPDHVIAAMLVGLGATVAAVAAPFDPEGGAYAAGPDGQPGAHSHHAGGHEHHSHG
jgi:urease accessory protein